MLSEPDPQQGLATAAEASPVPLNGLSTEEAARRLLVDGPNALPARRRRNWVSITLDVLREPMLALLGIGGLIYLLLGDHTEAVILTVLAGFSIMITVVQQARSERALEALRDLAAPCAVVIRDGIRQRIPGRDVVSSDVILLDEGERVPADAWVLESHGLQVNESLLTGEAVPVAKTSLAGPAAMAPRPGGGSLPYVFSGTLVTAGSATCHVDATGARTQIGLIGASLATIEEAVPRLSRQTGRIVIAFAIGGGATSVLVFFLVGALRGTWLDGALAAIALGMAMLPEEFPVVLAVFMAMGAMRLAQARVLTRRAAAIETLGSATVLCTDKTGTLTQNRMEIAQLRLADGQLLDVGSAPDLALEFRELVSLGALASTPRPTDPMEVAFHDLNASAGSPRDTTTWKLQHRYPLQSALLAISNVWDIDDNASRLVAAKGAPEAIAELCRLDPEQHARLKDATDEMASQGLRVLAVAEARPARGELPETPRAYDFTFCGLVGLRDPLRASVIDAVRSCHGAGMRVVMITGDYPQTARAIAAQAGISQQSVLTGSQLSAMSDTELAAEIAEVYIFARVLPEQKLRIVKALRARGEIVAMTGDGVNDAPSLKAADIGIAMGGRGTDVAREASALILLDDDFGSIPIAVRLGRRIYDNLQKAMGFIIAVHVPIAGLALMPLILGLPILMGPIHIAIIEIIIDPVCSLVFETETEEPDIMERPPRPPDAALLSRHLVTWSILQGGVAFTVIAGAVLWMSAQGSGEAEARTIAFFALVFTVLALVLVNRSFAASLAAATIRPNLALGVIVTLVLIMLAITALLPGMRDLLGVELVSWNEAAAIAGIGLGVLLILETLKGLIRAIKKPAHIRV